MQTSKCVDATLTGGKACSGKMKNKKFEKSGKFDSQKMGTLIKYMLFSGLGHRSLGD